MKRNVLIFTMLLAVSLITTSCSPNDNGGEGSEGTEQGEGGSEGPEGSGGEEGNESGMRWSINDTADEIVNGIHLILIYDVSTSSFIGTLENTNTTTVPQVRVEVHVFNANNTSTEFGPTFPEDMNPGEVRDVILPITAGQYVEFNMHPEVGGSGA